MKQIFTRSLSVAALTVLFTLGLLLLYLRLAVSGDRFAVYPTNRHYYENGSLVVAGTITDRRGVVLAKTEDGTRTFHEDETIRKATVHAVGDLEGFVATGVHSAFLPELTGYDRLNGAYCPGGKGNDLQLTIDAELSATAYRALGSRAGAVGVYNYQTGEMLCMVSTPSFDPAKGAKSAQNKGAYVNRLLSGSYAPGSIFKLVTALSVLENLPEAETLAYSCSRGVTIGGEWLSCLGNHGEVNLEEALVRSCNAAFAQFALRLGRDALTATARQVGFNKSLSVDGVSCTKSLYDVKEANDIDFGWSGIGQYSDTVNPFQYLTFMGAIAGGGRCAWPYFVEYVDSLSGDIKTLGGHRHVSMMKASAAERLGDMMRKDVTDHYGEGDFAGLELCAKTGTAEVGDKSTPHSWFVGFCRAADKPYAFVVVVENAGSGLGAASSVAARVLQAAPTVD